MGVGLTMTAAPAVGLLWRRWTKPLMRMVAMGLLLFTFFLGSARLINDYRTFNVYPIRYGAGQDIRPFIEPDEAVATNLPTSLLDVPSFYAQSHHVQYTITPDAFRRAEEFNIYYFCELDDGTPTPQWDDTFVTYATQYEECTLIQRAAS
jgi:hypothetical protein